MLSPTHFRNVHDNLVTINDSYVPLIITYLLTYSMEQSPS